MGKYSGIMKSARASVKASKGAKRSKAGYAAKGTAKVMSAAGQKVRKKAPSVMATAKRTAGLGKAKRRDITSLGRRTAQRKARPSAKRLAKGAVASNRARVALGARSTRPRVSVSQATKAKQRQAKTQVKRRTAKIVRMSPKY